MTTYTPTYPRPSLAPLAVLAGIVFAVALCTHALRHSAASDIADQCNQRGAAVILVKDLNGHCARLVEMQPGQYGREIDDENGNNLTAWLNAEARKNTLRKALTNLYHSGYTRITYVRPDLSQMVEFILAGLK